MGITIIADGSIVIDKLGGNLRYPVVWYETGWNKQFGIRTPKEATAVSNSIGFVTFERFVPVSTPGQFLEDRHTYIVQVSP